MNISLQRKNGLLLKEKNIHHEFILNDDEIFLLSKRKKEGIIRNYWFNRIKEEENFISKNMQYLDNI